MLSNLKYLWSPYSTLSFSSHNGFLKVIQKKVEVEGTFLCNPFLASALVKQTQHTIFYIDQGSTIQTSFASTLLSLERLFQNFASADAWKLSSSFQAKCVWDQFILMLSFSLNSFSPSLTFLHYSP